MCGLAGYIKTDAKQKFVVDEAVLERVHQKIAHRGPNAHKVWFDQHLGVALVHRRLSIVDLSNAGIQPMFDQEQSFVICFNGEIYNYKTLRTELELLGYHFVSQTDTEVFLYAFKQWGIACLDKLEGMFAGVLGNLKTDEWYLVRDRMGVKPFYFSLEGGYISFASEIKALTELPWIKKELNHRGLYHYLTYMVTPAPLTLYKNIYKLPIAHYIKIDARKEVTFHEWYTPLKPSIVYDKKDLENEEFCIKTIQSLMKEAVKKRMIADVPFGVFLSGGVDSSLITALMSQETDRVKTFNIAFSDGPEYSEVEWARKVAKTFNTEHHEITISEKEAFEFFESMVFYQDEPLADCVCIPLYYVAKLLKDNGVTVVQVGEGSDELYCGYQNYANYVDMYRRGYYLANYVPKAIKKFGVRVGYKLFPQYGNGIAMFDRWASNQHLFWSGAMVFQEKGKQQLYAHHDSEYDPVLAKMYPDFDQQLDSYAVVDYHLQKLYKTDPHADFLKSMIYLDLTHRLPELLLSRVDKMTMANSVEGRVPFLDHKHVEFALQVPSDFKYHQGVTKYILKRACEGILPYDVIYRKKMGFAAPVKRWFKSGTYFRPYFNDLLSKKRSSVQDLFNDAQISDFYYKTAYEESRDDSMELWVLQNLIAHELV